MLPFSLLQLTTLRKVLFGFLMFIITCLGPWSNALTLDTPHNRSSLEGLDGVGVLVEPLDPKIEADGLTAGDIAGLIIGKLQRAGIKVYSEEDFLISPGRPAVYLNAEISKLVTEAGEVWGYLCSVDIALTQNVYLERSPDLSVPASTWEAGVLGFFPDMANIRKKIEDAVDTFIGAYKTANESKEKGGRKK